MWVYKCIRVELSDWRRIDYYIEEELSLQEIDGLSITSITPIPNPPKLLPVGTRVRVFEEYDYYDKHKSLWLDRTLEYEIISIMDDRWYLLSCDDWTKDWWWQPVPARAVVPVLD